MPNGTLWGWITGYNIKNKPPRPKSLIVLTLQNVMLTTTRREAPIYNPTPIQRKPRFAESMIPKKDILFDLWQIVRKVDQEIGQAMARSMVH